MDSDPRDYKPCCDYYEPYALTEADYDDSIIFYIQCRNCGDKRRQWTW